MNTALDTNRNGPENQPLTDETQTSEENPKPEMSGTQTTKEEARRFSQRLQIDGYGIERWPEKVDGGVLLDELAAVYSRYAVLPKWAPEALALFTLHTYAFQLRDGCAYIGIESPEKRCGKTTLLSILSELVNRPVVASNISSPAWYRVIEELQPTLLIDEADTFLRGNHALRGILNAGCKRQTAFVVRVANERLRKDETQRPNATKTCLTEGNQESEHRQNKPKLVSFSSWCPKALAMIGRFPDTLSDRCILIRMQRKTAQESSERLRTLNGLTFKRKCARFVSDHEEPIALAMPQVPAELNDRASDTWEPLLALADIAGGQWPKLAREAAVGLASAALDQNPIGTLFLDILVYFASNQSERGFSRGLAAHLDSLTGRQWAELKKGKHVTELWLAQQLRPYQIRPKTIWIGQEHAKGYDLLDFRDAFRRYIPKSEIEALRAEVREAGKRERDKSEIQSPKSEHLPVAGPNGDS